jgi:(R)-2-hydroxyacyl-CoA dehydratese activating ATPase
MIVAGCDVGSLTAKAVVLGHAKILGYAVIEAKSSPAKSAEEVMQKALAVSQVGKHDIKRCVGTGYGREKIAFADQCISELVCHAKGANWIMPTVRTIIDIGGQDCKAMRVDTKGQIAKFTTNDKCASGTGRFLEVMADLMGLKLDDLGRLSIKAKNPVALACACTVWAQAEVIRLVNERTPLEDICASINEAMAGRVATMLNSIGIESDLCMTGGVAKNMGVVKCLESITGWRVRRLPIDPQIVGAVGAALLAREEVSV